MIVIEGTDNAGKSTLAVRLGTELDIPVYHHTKPKDVDEVVTNMNNILMTRSQVIWDRVPIISEQIYGPILRGRNMLFSVGDAMMHLFLAQKPLIIYVRPPTEVILGRPVEQKEHDTAEHIAGVSANLARLVEAYDGFMSILKTKQNANIFQYDWTRMPFEDAKSRVIGHLTQEE